MSFENLDELILNARDGDKTAFSQLVKLNQQVVFRYCYSMLHHRHDAEDMTQETFINAFKHLSRYKHEGNFIGWLISIAHRLCLNKFSMNKRLMALINRISKETRYATTYYADEDNGHVFNLLKMLKPKARAIVVLKVIHGFNYEEMSHILHESPANLRKQFERAKKRLNKLDTTFINGSESENNYDFTQELRASNR